MILHPPIIITPRLCAGVQIGKAFVSIERAGKTRDGRDTFRYAIDLDDPPRSIEYMNTDLYSGVGGCSLQNALGTLLCFLSAAGEAYSYRMRSGRETENLDLFDDVINEWAYLNADEIASLQLDLEESGQTYIEE